MRYIAFIIVIFSFTIASASLVLSSPDSKLTNTQIIQKNADMAMAEKKEDVLSETTQTTPSWVYYFTVFNFLWTVGFSSFTWKLSRSASIKDQYWFREILLPTCIKPLQEFAEQQTSNLKSFEHGSSALTTTKQKKAYKEYLSNFKDHKADVLTKFMVLLPIKREIYDDVVGKLDDLEDSVTLYCATKSFDTVKDEVRHGINESHPGQAIYSTLGEIMVMISDKHLELYT